MPLVRGVQTKTYDKHVVLYENFLIENGINEAQGVAEKSAAISLPEIPIWLGIRKKMNGFEELDGKQQTQMEKSLTPDSKKQTII